MTLLAVVAVTVAGLMVGVELCVALFVNPILDRLPGDNGLAGRADGARILGRVMPLWYSSSIVLAVVLAASRWPDSGAVPVTLGAALFVVSIAMSILLLVPINDRAKTWTADDAPGDWREQLGRWDRWHLLRVAVIIAAFVLVVIGAVCTG